MYNGFINLDKELGISSARAVDKVKYLLSKHSGKKVKIGHAGTLDPLASGVLVLALGNSTKLVSQIMEAEKQYEFTISWGHERATDDAEGEIIASSGKLPSLSEIEAVIHQFIGDVSQAPPAFSAIKINGKRAYELARAGKIPEMKERIVRVYDLSILNLNCQSLISTSFLIKCGKGTYIRSLARDIGRKLGVYGYVSMLKRTRVGKFSIEDAISLENIEKMLHKGELGFLRS